MKKPLVKPVVEEKPLIELIVAQIEKRIPQVLSNSYEEANITMLCDILTEATDISEERKAWIAMKLRLFASVLKSNDEQRAKRYLTFSAKKLHK
jgi:hypothetical protein